MATADDSAPLTRSESEHSPPLIDFSAKTGESMRKRAQRTQGTVWLPREDASQERGASASDDSMRAYLKSARTSSQSRSDGRPVELRPVAAPTSGSHVVNVVTRQPHLVPIQNSFDAESLVAYSMINRQHPGTANQLNSVIVSIGSAVQRMATNQSLQTQGEVTYSEMLDGLLMDDENLHTPAEANVLVYSNVKFLDIDGQEKRTLPVGQALLTSKRLLLLSCTTKQSGSLKNKSPLIYTVGATVESATVFFPIPLENIKSVEMVTSSLSKATADISGTAGCLKDCVCCCCWCCLTKWAATPLQQTYSATRYVQLGVLMPPWQEKMTVVLQLPSPFSLKKTTAFVASLQRLMR